MKINSSKKKHKLIVLSGILALLMYLFQNIYFPETTHPHENKISQYDFQLRYWSEALRKEFDNIEKSGVVDSVILSNNKKITISEKYLKDLDIYHRKMLHVLQILKNQYQIPLQITIDICSMSPLVLTTDSEMKEFTLEFNKLKDLIKEQERRIERLKNYSSELKSTLFIDANEMSEEQKANILNKQISLIIELYSSDNLFMKYNIDTYKPIDDLEAQSYRFLNLYSDIVDRYNKEIARIESNKQLALLILTTISIIIAISIETKE